MVSEFLGGAMTPLPLDLPWRLELRSLMWEESCGEAPAYTLARSVHSYFWNEMD